MNPWKKFHNDFNALMEEEDRIVEQRISKDWFYAHINYRESGELGSWWFESIPTESLKARFELLVTEAGMALGCPPGIPPLPYWLHHLRLDLLANESKLVRMFSDTVGIIERLFEASAIYCARLDRQFLQKAAMPCEESPLGQRTGSSEVIAEPKRRRGYRREVRQWMALERLKTIEIAAKRLGISQSALKSIMSDRGKARYGEATVTRVLGIIGFKGE